MGRQAGRAGVIIKRASDARTAGSSTPVSVRTGITSVVARLTSGCWRGVVVLMLVQVGDSRRHKGISHAAQRGLVGDRGFLTRLAKEAGEGNGY